MKLAGAIVSASLLALLGCRTSSDSARPSAYAGSSAAASPQSSPISSVGRSSASSGPSEFRSSGETVRLPTVKVHDWALSDFGFSVRTNFEVLHGGAVQWMEISGVEVTGPARAAGLATGDKIFAVDRLLVTQLDRDTMLAALFQRKKGDRVRLLISHANEAFPRFVELVATRP